MSTHSNKPSTGEWILKFVLPPILILILVGTGATIVSKKFKPKNEEKEPQPQISPVEVTIAQEDNILIEVESQGTVIPRIQTQLIAEVSGRIESVSPQLYTGGTFKKGDILATIEALDYKANLATAQSALADAKLLLAQEEASAAQAKVDWDEIGQGKKADSLVLRHPQLKRAQANLKAAKTRVEIARRDLKRTNITAPYNGQVKEKFIELGQFVNARNTPVAHIYSTDMAEVRLPLTLEDAQYIELPNNSTSTLKPHVTLRAKQGNKILEWEGVIDRSEGTIDPQSRLIHFIAQIKDPYSLQSNNNSVPLEIGRFVEAKIQGITLKNAFKLPRKALRDGNRIYSINDQNRVEISTVDVFKKNEYFVIITSGINTGDRISLTNLEYAVNGMQVSIETETENTSNNTIKTISNQDKTSAE